MSTSEQRTGTSTWPELAEGLYSFLTGRGATIQYEFDKFEVLVPRDAGDTSPQAKWQLNGALRVRTSETGQ